MNVLIETHVQIDAESQEDFDRKLSGVMEGYAETLAENGLANETGLDDDTLVAMLVVKPTPTFEGDLGGEKWLEGVVEGAESLMFPVGNDSDSQELVDKIEGGDAGDEGDHGNVRPLHG